MGSGMVGPINNFSQVRFGAYNTRTPRAEPVAPGITAEARRETHTTVFKHARSLRSNVAALRKAFQASDLKAVELQGNHIGLDFTERASTSTSYEEVNDSPNSYNTHTPVWTDDSTSVVTIDGDYDGDQGTDTLRFRVTRAGTVGSNTRNIDVRWYRSNGDQQGRIRIRPSHDPGRIYTLPNKLRVSFTAGTLESNDEFFLDVSTAVGTAVNPDNPLDGTRENDADLNWGENVRAGTFKVNGETITVDAGDSLNDVLDKINASDAGVTAEFDAETERVQIRRNDFGDGNITLTNDSSRFLRAVKLNGVSAVRGRQADDRAIIDDVAPLSGISSGTVRIGSTNVSFDTSSDSLEDVINRINASGAGVTASLSRTTGKFSIRANREGEALTLDDRGTNLFGTLGLLEGTHRASGGPPARKISEILTEIGKDINAIFDKDLAETDIVKGLRNGIRAAFGATVGEDGNKDLIKTDFGFSADFREGRGAPVKFGVAQARKFRASIRRGSLASKRFFAHSRGTKDSSLLDSLGSLAKAADEKIVGELGVRGLYLSRIA